MTDRDKAVKLYEAWEADKAGFEYFQDFAFSTARNPYGWEVADKAIEMLWSGTFK